MNVSNKTHLNWSYRNHDRRVYRRNVCRTLYRRNHSYFRLKGNQI